MRGEDCAASNFELECLSLQLRVAHIHDAFRRSCLRADFCLLVLSGVSPRGRSPLPQCDAA